MEWSNDVVFEFLSLYEGEPVIWNPRDSNHKNRNLVHDAWKRILDKMSIKFTITELKKKKDVLMATFRKLLQKMKTSSKTGSGTQDVFKPNWFAFEFMYRFLHGIYLPNETIDSEVSRQEEVDDPSLQETEETQQTIEIEETQQNVDSSNKIQDVSSGPSGIQEQTNRAFHIPEGSVKKGKKRQHANISNENEKRMDEAYKILTNLSKEQEYDDCSLYCELLAKKLRALDETKREIVMLQIDHFMFSVKHETPGQVYFPQINHFQYSSAYQNQNHYFHNQKPPNFYPQQPPNSHIFNNSFLQTNGSSTSSPLASPLSPHYRTSTKSNDSELSLTAVNMTGEASRILNANNEDNRSDEDMTLGQLFDL